jgi:hypothetical protein
VIIIVLVIIYQGHSPCLVRVRCQEELEAIFAGALCYTDLTGAGQRSNRCPPASRSITSLTGQSHQFDRWKLVVQVFKEEKFISVVSPIPPSRRHQGLSRPKQHLQRGEIHFRNAPITDPMKPDHAFTGPQNQLDATDRQSLEGANQWKDSKQLLKAMMVSFYKQERLPRATKTTREGRSQSSPSFPLHSTGQLNVAHYSDSLKMNDNLRDQEKNEDMSSQYASEEDNWRNKISG